jgi:hypothetical protein
MLLMGQERRKRHEGSRSESSSRTPEGQIQFINQAGNRLPTVLPAGVALRPKGLGQTSL